MKTSISIGSAYYNGEDWDDLVDYTQEADKLGVDQAWSAEAWGMDAIVPLAYLAAKTEKITTTGCRPILSPTKIGVKNKLSSNCPTPKRAFRKSGGRKRIK